MPRDYYVVLGIKRTADPERIKQAYRRIAKRFHPDRSQSEETTDRFLEARTAYETLSDAEKRRDYDAALSGREASRPQRSERRPARPAPGSAPPSDDLREAFFPGVCQEGHWDNIPEDPHIEMILSPREALRGGRFSLNVQLTAPCGHCGGRGQSVFFICPVCGGCGRIAFRDAFDLIIPPCIPDGTTATLSMAAAGFAGTRLHILIRVAASPSSR
jgi:molecular chaperone DnaJ